MAYRKEVIVPKAFKVTPRRGLTGQNLAVWSTGYELPVASFIWDILAARAIANQEEVDLIVKARMEMDGTTYNEAYNQLVLESGLYMLADQAGSEEPPQISPEIGQKLSRMAETRGTTVDNLLESFLED